MSKQGSGLQKCMDAFERLKNGKPNNQSFKHLTPKQITPSVVSQEAGLDAGYLKKSRENHKPLITMINAFRLKEEPESLIRKRDYDKLRTDNDALKLENKRLVMQRDQALSRELLLVRKLRLMEKELLDIKASIGDNVKEFTPKL
ncbi:hypothetical protein AAHL06_002762 [Vibrio parahaemolyticus]|uniref:Uncharacterized protein n=1 Tax=Vibrio parahaemolyticus TaxID=670 RepID=A0AAX0M4F1_VIBPH|nr:hypothetical protein [Vibrio parahaemolyticus]EGR5854857.1 hypothetical protein [Vibrio parahaemolyticus]EJG0043652.1 hypothetical protein [Vibrio parahaemolyticus]ELA9389100.1 hypothetical protein [Vibrio parahaemolyticus]EMA2506493.1 hypothetical protein [Vibrio parahaemolyticus]EMB2755253.1 hypothetical protein [Vibrio parahaemolyticus]